MTEAERAIREALPFATPGRWEHVFSNGGREHYVYAPDAHYRRDLPGPVKVAWLPYSPGSNRDANDAVYIAACNPENIAALLAEIDRLTRERDEARAEREALRAACKTTLMLRQLGGMMPGTKAVIDVAIHHAEEALAQVKQERSEQGEGA